MQLMVLAGDHLIADRLFAFRVHVFPRRVSCPFNIHAGRTRNRIYRQQSGRVNDIKTVDVDLVRCGLTNLSMALRHMDLHRQRSGAIDDAIPQMGPMLYPAKSFSPLG